MIRFPILFLYAVHFINIYQVYSLERGFLKVIKNSRKGSNQPETMFEEVGAQFRAGDYDDVTKKAHNETWCICSRIYDPVCATNERSYFNLCQFECAVANTKNTSLRILHQGNCIPF